MGSPTAAMLIAPDHVSPNAPLAPVLAANEDDFTKVAENDDTDLKPLPPRTMLKLYVEAIKTNPKLSAKLQKRRFELVKVLEGAAQRTDPNIVEGKYGDLDDIDGDGIADLAADDEDLEMTDMSGKESGRSTLEGAGTSLAGAVLSQANKGPKPEQKVKLLLLSFLNRQ